MRGLLPSVGITPTAAGSVTLSAEVDTSKFKDIFGLTATEQPSSGGEREFGTSGGHTSPDLKIPAVLSEFVESISAAPSHIYLNK